jgi:hypothetical protein
MAQDGIVRPVGRKNYHAIERPKHAEVKARVWELINGERAISKLQICRVLNGRDQAFCKYARTCYANSRKRGEYDKIHVADCKISFMQIRYAVKKLIADGVVWSVRQKWPDTYQNRGYDYMAICRPVNGHMIIEGPEASRNKGVIP